MLISLVFDLKMTILYIYTLVCNVFRVLLDVSNFPPFVYILSLSLLVFFFSIRWLFIINVGT